jgi:hypothetical protein
MKAAVLCVLIGLGTGVVGAQRGPAGAACDKTCLQGIADTYLAALVGHDPSKAPMAPNAKFTEQAQPMVVGEGQLWKLTTEGPTTFQPSLINRRDKSGSSSCSGQPAAPPPGGGAGPPLQRPQVPRTCSWPCA